MSERYFCKSSVLFPSSPKNLRELIFRILQIVPVCLGSFGGGLQGLPPVIGFLGGHTRTPREPGFGTRWSQSTKGGSLNTYDPGNSAEDLHGICLMFVR